MLPAAPNRSTAIDPTQTAHIALFCKGQCAGFSRDQQCRKALIPSLGLNLSLPPPIPTASFAVAPPALASLKARGKGERAYTVAAQSGRDFLTTSFPIRCPFVKRVTETVRWHPRAQHSVHIVTAVQCDSILRNSKDYGLFLTDGRVLLRMAKKWPRWQADFPMGLAPSAVLIQFFCRFGVVHNPR